MNKYTKYYDDIEKTANNKEKYLIDDLMTKFKNKVIDFYDFNSSIYFYELESYELLDYILENIHMFNKQLQEYTFNNILNRLNETRLINLYIFLICEAKTKKDFKKLNNLLNSFNITTLIKNITYNQEKNFFILTTNKGKKIKFKELFEDIVQFNNSNKNCHNITQKVLYQNKQDVNVYGITVLNENFNYSKEYHSFVLCNNIVNDFAHNIIISFDDYKTLYNPEILLSVNAKQLIQNAERLEIKDESFKNDDSPYILKYAIHKQIKKDKKRLIRKN